MPAITISSGFGAGGAFIAPKVARTLGFSLLDRAISVEVAERLNVTPDEAEAGEHRKSFADRFFGALVPLSLAIPGDQEPLLQAQAAEAEGFREQAEAVVREALPRGVVVLGRAGAAMLRNEPQVLRVRLYGSDDDRVAMVMRNGGGSDESTVRRQLAETDRARAKYVEHLYGHAIDDPGLYHLQLNTPKLTLDQSVNTIVAAFHSLVEPAGQTETQRG